MKVIVGLGNPGRKYEETRHNVGFWVVDKMASRLGLAMTKSKFQSLVGAGDVYRESVLLVKPMTFMNLSGDAVREVIQFYKLNPASDLIVVYDDMDFLPGQVKLRQQGSAGGHNGMKSIILSLGTESFCRIRLGIGRPPLGMDTISHVLGRFSRDDRIRVEKVVDASVDAVLHSIEYDFEHAMSQYNQMTFCQ